jgi:hypothetical protein
MAIIQMSTLRNAVQKHDAGHLLNMQKANILIHPAMTAAQVKHLLGGRRLVARPEPKDAA